MSASWVIHSTTGVLPPGSRGPVLSVADLLADLQAEEGAESRKVEEDKARKQHADDASHGPGRLRICCLLMPPIAL